MHLPRKVLTDQALALRFPGRICNTMNQLSILSAEVLAHTMTLRTKQILAPLHLLPLLHFAARALQPPDAGVVGLLGAGKLQVKRSFTKNSGIVHSYTYTYIQ